MDGVMIDRCKHKDSHISYEKKVEMFNIFSEKDLAAAVGG